MGVEYCGFFIYIVVEVFGENHKENYAFCFNVKCLSPLMIEFSSAVCRNIIFSI